MLSRAFKCQVDRFRIFYIIIIIANNSNNRRRGVSCRVGAGAEVTRVARREAAVGGPLLAGGGTKTHVIAGPLVSHGAFIEGYSGTLELWIFDAAAPLVAARFHLRQQGGLGH